MAKSCDICERKPLTGKSRSHSNIPTKRKQNINLQNKIINGKKVKICTGCWRTYKKDISL